MSHMRRVNLRELHNNTGRIADLAAKGERILIERRGVVIAELRAATEPQAKGGLPKEHWEWLAKQTKARGKRPMLDQTIVVSEDRDRW